MAIRPEPNDFARRHRREMTDAERRLWGKLHRGGLAGTHFRRQHPIGRYVTDFVCLDALLIIEVDGGQHADNNSDEARTEWLHSQGFEILRFWNNDVLRDINTICEVILATVERRLAAGGPKT